MPNKTFHQKKCKDAGGVNPATAESQVDAGELYNGMVLPFANMSIRGALWYQ